jgi:hypothetical protein
VELVFQSPKGALRSSIVTQGITRIVEVEVYIAHVHIKLGHSKEIARPMQHLSGTHSGVKCLAILPKVHERIHLTDQRASQLDLIPGVRKPFGSCGKAGHGIFVAGEEVQGASLGTDRDPSVERVRSDTQANSHVS